MLVSAVITGKTNGIPGRLGKSKLGSLGKPGSLGKVNPRLGGKGIEGKEKVGNVKEGKAGSLNPGMFILGRSSVGSLGSSGSLGKVNPRLGGKGIEGSSGSGTLTLF
jgi:hypothetical protein